MLSIINMHNAKNEDLSTENSYEEVTTSKDNTKDNSKTEANYSDLSFLYKISKNSINEAKEASLTISNNSNCIFNGTITIELLDSNNNTISTFKLPVKNLAPNNSKNTTIEVNDKTESILCSFSGDFTDKPSDKDSADYIIENMHVGNKYICFDLYTSDFSLANLESICREFKQTYNNNICSGFLIYFLNNEGDSNSNNSRAEFFCDNSNNTNVLCNYDDNKSYNIS